MITIVTIIKWQNIYLIIIAKIYWVIVLSGIVLIYHLLLRETNITVNIAIFKQLTKAQRDKVSATSCAGKFF